MDFSYKSMHEGMSTNDIIQLDSMLRRGWEKDPKLCINASERLNTNKLAQLAGKFSLDKALKNTYFLMDLQEHLPGLTRKVQHIVQCVLRAAWLRHWSYYGYNTYRLDENMVSKLLLTKIPKIKTSALKSPFPAFRVEIPRGFLGILDLDDQVCEASAIDFLRIPWLRYTNMDALNEATRAALSPEVEVETPEVKWGIFINSTEPRCPGQLFSHHLESQFETVAEFFDVHDHNLLETKLENASINAGKILVVNLLNAVVNKVIAPQKLRINTPGKKRNVIRPSVFSFRSSKINIQLIESGKAFAQGARAKKSWNIRTKFIVRGHWRGKPGRSGEQDIWIEPFWKGPEGEEGWARIAKVEA